MTVPRESMRTVFGKALVALGLELPNLVVLDADTSHSTQTWMFGGKFSERFINCGIAEANMVSVAAGMASCGMIPVVSTFAFLLTLRAGEQVRSQVACSGLNVKLAGGYAGLSDFADGASHQSVMDIAVMRAMPNMTVICPGDAGATEELLRQAITSQGPVYFRLSRDEVPRYSIESGRIRIGRAIRRRDGKDIAVVSTGSALEDAMRAAETLQSCGISARVVEMHTVKPLDEAELAAAASDTGAVLTVEEHSVIGGLGDAAASLLAQRRLAPRFGKLGIRDSFGQSGSYDALKEHYGISAAAIHSAACELLGLVPGDAPAIH